MKKTQEEKCLAELNKVLAKYGLGVTYGIKISHTKGIRGMLGRQGMKWISKCDPSITITLNKVEKSQ
jgi:hypothetical protein